MGFSKDLFMQVRESEESYFSSLNSYLDDYWSSNSHQSVCESVEDDESEVEPTPDFYEIGYPNNLGHWVLVKTCFTESEADKEFKKLRRENADYRNYKKMLHVKRCYVKAQA